jgi:hypothetical protein
MNITVISKYNYPNLKWYWFSVIVPSPWCLYVGECDDRKIIISSHTIWWYNIIFVILSLLLVENVVLKDF